MRQIEIAWPDVNIAVIADLDERNGALADALWAALPYRSLQGHALVAGHLLYHVAPIHALLHLPASHRVDRRTLPDGTLSCSQNQHLSIKYGTLTEPMPAAPVGQVRPECMRDLAEVGHAVWDAVYSAKQPVIAEVRRAGEGGGHALPRLAATDSTADGLIGDLYAETERIWLTAPRELVDLYNGHIRSGAGSFATVVTTLVFVNAETLRVSNGSYGVLTRAANAGVPIETLRRLTSLMIVGPAEFLGYCGLEKLWAFTQRVLTGIDDINLQDFTAVVSHMALYLNGLGGWNLQLFPWKIGDHLRQSADLVQPT